MDTNTSTLLRQIKDETQWSEPRIAVEIGVSQATVNRIMHGQVDCKSSTLRAIEALHKRVVKKRRATKPAASQVLLAP